jgi:hypothetical protein
VSGEGARPVLVPYEPESRPGVAGQQNDHLVAVFWKANHVTPRHFRARSGEASDSNKKEAAHTGGLLSCQLSQTSTAPRDRRAKTGAGLWNYCQCWGGQREDGLFFFLRGAGKSPTAHFTPTSSRSVSSESASVPSVGLVILS